MRKKRAKNFIIFLAILLIASIVVAKYAYPKAFKKNNSFSKRNSGQNELNKSQNILYDQTSNTNSKSIENAQSKKSQNLAKPILNKSSGNNGPVPIGIPINFVCQSSEGAGCVVELKNKNGNIINLGYQPFKNNGKDQYYADWYWTSAEGDWTIVARLKNNQGEVSESDPQNLSVK